MSADAHSGGGKASSASIVIEALPGTAAIGGTIYALCAPTVHGSFAARLGGPLAGGALTYGTWRVTGDTAASKSAWTPAVAPTRGGATAGLALTF